jgi:hypothetical protein
MKNKNAIAVVVFFGILLFTGLLMLQTCDGPPSSELPGSFRLVIKASCPIAKDEQQFIADIKVLSTTFAAGNSPDKFFIPNVSLVRIDRRIQTSSDSASFDIPYSLMHYFKTSLVEGTQFKDMRQDEEEIYFASPYNDPRFTDFRSLALRGHAEDGELPVVNCADSNEFFMVDVLPENPPCPDKYWNNAAALKKHLEKQFGVKAPTQDVVIYYLCGNGQSTASSSTTAKDSDGDSVEDEKDDCPTIAGKVIHNGCPDEDNDGVKDEWDRCPSLAGEASNNGCPKGMLPPPPAPIEITAVLSKDWQSNPTEPNNTIVVSIKNDVLSQVHELVWKATPTPRANNQFYTECAIIPGIKSVQKTATIEIVLSTAAADCGNCPYEIEIMANDQKGNNIASTKIPVKKIKCHSGN